MNQTQNCMDNSTVLDPFRRHFHRQPRCQRMHSLGTAWCGDCMCLRCRECLCWEFVRCPSVYRTDYLHSPEHLKVYDRTRVLRVSLCSQGQYVYAFHTKSISSLGYELYLHSLLWRYSPDKSHFLEEKIFPDICNSTKATSDLMIRCLSHRSCLRLWFQMMLPLSRISLDDCFYP